MSNPTKRPWRLRLTLLSVIASVGIGTLIWQQASLSGLTEVADEVGQWDNAARMARWAFISLLIVGWPALVHAFERTMSPSNGQLIRLRNARGRVVAWLLILELSVGGSLAALLRWVVD